MKSQFTGNDFSGFRYQKIITHKSEVVKLYPELSRYKEFDSKNYKGRLSADKIFRYALLVYTNNVLLESIPDITKRKREAAILAGFNIDPDTEKFAPEVESIIKCENSKVNALIILIIRLNKNSDLQQMLAFEEARSRQIGILINGGDEKSKEATSTVMENVRKLSNYIEDLRSTLLNEDEQPDIIHLLYENIVHDNLGIKPEDIALARREGTLDKILKKP